MCQFLFNHKVGGWEVPKLVRLGQRDRFPCNNTFALTVLLRTEIKAGKTFAAFSLPQSRAGGPKPVGLGQTDRWGQSRRISSLDGEVRL